MAAARAAAEGAEAEANVEAEADVDADAEVAAEVAEAEVAAEAEAAEAVSVSSTGSRPRERSSRCTRVSTSPSSGICCTSSAFRSAPKKKEKYRACVYENEGKKNIRQSAKKGSRTSLHENRHKTNLHRSLYINVVRKQIYIRKFGPVFRRFTLFSFYASFTRFYREGAPCTRFRAKVEYVIEFVKLGECGHCVTNLSISMHTV